MIFTHKTTSELMAHFRIRKELYNTFASWLVANAERYNLLVPGTENQRHRRYNTALVAQHYERKWHFGTADVAPQLAQPAAQESERDIIHAEVVKARRERRRAAVAMLREARRHATHAMIADTHASISEARCEKYLKQLGLEFIMQRASRWAFLILTGLALVSSIINLFF